MVDTGSKVDLWRLERVVGREMNCEKEDAALERTIARAHNRGLPVELRWRKMSVMLSYDNDI